MQIEAAVGEAKVRPFQDRQLFADEAVDDAGKPGEDGGPQIFLEEPEIDALRQPEPGEDPLAQVLLAVDLLEARLAEARFLDALEIALGGAVVHVAAGGGGPLAYAEEAAGAAARRDVFDPAPVQRIVHRLEARAGEVGDL